jgi:hypothetical protein
MSTAYNAGQYIASQSLPFTQALSHTYSSTSALETAAFTLGYATQIVNPVAQVLVYGAAGYQVYNAIKGLF